MSDTIIINTHRDFDEIYNRPDPRAYYRALKPAGYRMPDVTSRFLRDNHAAIAEAFSVPKLHVLDFACGFGAVAAMLRHTVTMNDLFSYYDTDAPEDLHGADARFYGSRRYREDRFDIAGLDIATQAVNYARACGLIDKGFDDNLLEAEAGEDLRAFLKGTHVIYEAGAVLSVLLPALARLLETATSLGARPWLVYAPRYDVDDDAFIRSLGALDYVVEPVNSHPIRYRRLISQEERELHKSTIRALGRDPSDGFEGDWIVLDQKLARPRGVADAMPVGTLQRTDTKGGNY